MSDFYISLFCPLQIKCRSTLRISGLVPSAYWCGQAAVDIPFYYLILSFMTIILFSFHTGNLLTSSNLTAVVRTVASNTGSAAQTPCSCGVTSPLLSPGPVYCWLRSGHDPLHLCVFVWLRPSPEQQGFLLCDLHDGETSSVSDPHQHSVIMRFFSWRLVGVIPGVPCRLCVSLSV